MFAFLFLFLSITGGNTLLKSMTKPDGTVDMASLINHIVLLEQEIESRDCSQDVAALMLQLSTNQDRLHEVESKLQEMQTRLFYLESESLSSDKSTHGSKGGATFTHWGKTTCPTGNTMVYKGYAAGTWWNNTASSASILCLPENPVYAEHTTGGHNAYIYGTEYETSYTGSPFNELQDEDMPCAVCRSESKTSAIMVPARNQCHPGWELEYWGYLMGAHDTHASAEFICVDNDPDFVPGSEKSRDGQTLYMVQSVCGSLPCPPYEDYWELTCSVCSQ